MKFALALCFLATLVAAEESSSFNSTEKDSVATEKYSVATEKYSVASEKYTTKYDNIDLDQILKNERLLISYVDCVMERGKCSEDGNLLKDAIPEALQNECEKCSEKQRAGSEKVIKFLVENKREIYNELSAKYDPEGIYTKKYNEDAKRLGLKLID